LSETVLILGAKGRFGRAASHAFHDAGWEVKAFVRNWPHGATNPYSVKIEGDAFDVKAVAKAAQGCDVIVNALNPPYEKWEKDLPRLTHAVISAAEDSGAVIMVPGNVYNFGKNMPPVLDENTPHNAETRKGLLRIQMEKSYAHAANDGVQTIILRGGDFIEREKTGNWFDTYITPKVGVGKITYPGPLECMHAWAYLPDMARALEMLAQKRSKLEPYSTFCFEGYNLTGADLIKAIEACRGRTLKVSSMPWFIMRMLGLFSPSIKEVLEMQYLWKVPHAIDGTKLSETLKGFQFTPIETALTDALAGK